MDRACGEPAAATGPPLRLAKPALGQVGYPPAHEVSRRDAPAATLRDRERDDVTAYASERFPRHQCPRGSGWRHDPGTPARRARRVVSDHRQPPAIPLEVPTRRTPRVLLH